MSLTRAQIEPVIAIGSLPNGTACAFVYRDDTEGRFQTKGPRVEVLYQIGVGDGGGEWSEWPLDAILVELGPGESRPSQDRLEWIAKQWVANHALEEGS